jgi:hypothetical protein
MPGEPEAFGADWADPAGRSGASPKFVICYTENRR